MTTTYDCSLEMIIYLKAKPVVSLNRVKSRARPEDNEVDLDFLESLHLCHENWLGSTSTDANGGNYIPKHIITVDAEMDLDFVLAKIVHDIQNILNDDNTHIHT